MKAYIIAATLGDYQEALRLLRLHERAAVHLTAMPGSWAREEPLYYAPGNGQVQVLAGTAPVAGGRLAA
jgi:hypothetical protein